jgi:uncharacterized lipoprotein YddW (UPF0748 family)
MKKTVAIFAGIMLAAPLALHASAPTNSWTFAGHVDAGGFPQRLRWDVDHSFDIPEKGCIEFDLTCSSAEFSFTLHARRGVTWVPYKIEAGLTPGKTHHFSIARSDWLLKDLPGRKLDDWTGFDGFRLSAWRMGDEQRDIECSIRNFEITTNTPPAPAVRQLVRPAPRLGERRLAWCHRAWGMSENTRWEGTIRNLKACGFTDVIPNMCRPGGAYYSSKVLPVMPYVAGHGDQLEACLKACRKYGVKCHVWKVCWNIGKHPGNVAEGFVEQMRKEGRLAVSSDGTEMKWLCPSHPANRKAEIDSMLELASKGVDGIHFDFIRYSAMNVCFCGRCRAAFKEKYGVEIKPGGFDIDAKGNEVLRKWTDFRCENITAIVRETSRLVRGKYPGVEISAAVFGRAGEIVRVNVAQDWGLWCREKYVDFVCPMDYVNSVSMLQQLIERNKTVASGVKCYPGIGCSTMRVVPRGNKKAKAVLVAEQVETIRAAGFDGFTVFDYTPPTANILDRVFRERKKK